MSEKVSLGKVLLVGVAMMCISNIANAALGDMSIGGGVGVMGANDKKSYMDDTASFYGEIQIAYDMGIFQVGSTVGYFERTTDIFDDDWSWRNRRDRYHYEDVLAYLPLEVYASIMPFRGGDEKSAFQPYVGVGVGGILAIGDNDDSYVMVSPRLGIEFLIGSNHVIDLKGVYHFVLNDEDGGYDGLNYYSQHPDYEYDLDYYTVTVAYRYKFLFGEHRNK